MFDNKTRWIVRRDHLHAGLAESARQHGANIITGARILSFDDESQSPSVTVSTPDNVYTFDLLIGADGIKSAVRNQLFPAVQPITYGPAVAYRHTMSASTIRDALASEPDDVTTNLLQNFNMWCGPHGYLVTYPLSGGREMNITICFYTASPPVDPHDPATWPRTIVENADLSELTQQLKDYPTIIQKIWAKAPGSNRWPLLHIPKMDRWTNAKQNVVLMGDASHAMNPALAQGCATAMEDAAFLGVIVGEVQLGNVELGEGMALYEERRVPKAWLKQQTAFVEADFEMGGPLPAILRSREAWNGGACEKGSDEEEAEGPYGHFTSERVRVARDASSRPETVNLHSNGGVLGSQLPKGYRSWHNAFHVESNKRTFFYDAEADADDAVCQYLLRKGEVLDERRGVVDALERKLWGVVLAAEDEDGTEKEDYMGGALVNGH